MPEESCAKKAKTSEAFTSRLGFGCWQLASTGAEGDYWGLEYTQEMANANIAQAVASGITFIDTAGDYSKGASEKQLGVALKALDPELRSKVVLGTKIVPNLCGNPEAALKESLERLQVDAVDLYQVHWPIDKNAMAHFANGHASFGASTEVDQSSVPSMEGCFRALAALQAAGKVKRVGVCNFGVEQLKEAQAYGCVISSNQICYNLIFRAAEFGIIDYCKEHGIRLIGYSPLMQGILHGRYEKPEEVPMYRARTRHFAASRHSCSRHGEDGHEELTFKTLAELKKVADKAGFALQDLALAYPLAKGFDTVIAGFTKSAYIESNLAAASLQLSDELVKELDATTEELKTAMGPNADLWQGVVDGKQTGRVM